MAEASQKILSPSKRKLGFGSYDKDEPSSDTKDKIFIKEKCSRKGGKIKGKITQKKVQNSSHQ